MKKPFQPPRRSDAKAQSDDFTIDSSSAFSEYKKHRPSTVIEENEQGGRIKLVPKDYDLFLEQACNRTHDMVIALDHISDPRNLGAIVRSAAFFGVKDVVIPNDRQAAFTQASVATSAGGFALCDLVCVVNLKRAMEDLKEAGYWILGADMGGMDASSIKGKYEKVVLVLGSEEKGLSRTVKDKCDLIVGISSPGQTLESLNVSVAGGILMSQLALVK